MQTIEKNELLDAIIKGRLEFFRAYSELSPLSGAAFQKNEDDSVYYSSGMDYAPCNGVIEGGDDNPSDQVIDKAIEFFGSKKLPFIWWIASKNLEKKGFQFGGILTGIALEINSKMSYGAAQTSNIKIQRVSNKDQIEFFTSIAVNGFGMNPSTVEQFQAINIAGMQLGEMQHYLAFHDDKPVGTATLSTSDSSAGVWNLATLPEYRKHGVGTALVSTALEEAKKLNYRQVMAILMPKGMAWGLFTKLGFKECCQFPFYVHGTSAADLEK